jgi:uncharacterized SAM-dependent methyltransferase
MVNVAIHASQFPDNVRRDLLESLRARRVNHKFHYDSLKQTQKWLTLHQAYSPSRSDADCAAAYDQSSEATAVRVKAERVHLIGLGCGGGQKDTRLLGLLKARNKEVFYTPCDVSLAMVLAARQTALAAVAEQNCFPVVCDLASAGDLPAALEKQSPPRAARLITFFGMLPNFEPHDILPRLATLVRRGDLLLFSANLAPGEDYADGMKKILPQYDNPLTRDWLMTFLLDLDVEQSDGQIRFGIEDDPAGSGLKRVTAHFHFSRCTKIQVDDASFEFRADESIRLFFSYRHTPGIVRTLLSQHGLAVPGQWVAKSGEEGVFLCHRGSMKCDSH